jgi:hypothetical protein
MVVVLLRLIRCCIGSAGEGDQKSPVRSILIARTGEQFQAPHVLTYHLLEFEQDRGRWIFPDFGAVDYGHGDYREVFLGAGVTDFHNKFATLTQELYFVQDTGGAAHSARYLWPWPVFDLRFNPRLTSRVVFYPCIPLNRAAKAEYDIDHAKMEYAVNQRFTVGGGYSSSKSKGSAWVNKPFFTTTVTTREGAFEFWLQRMPGGGQLQVRYTLVHEGR